MNNIVFLFTSAYPFGKGEQFLETEIKYLANRFASVVIIPDTLSVSHRDIPKNVLVDTEFAKGNVRITRFILYFFYFLINFGLFCKEILIRRKISLDVFLKNIHFIGNGERLHKWFLKKYSNDIKNYSRTILYSYWMKYQSFGIAKINKKISCVGISRAHGGDLYENADGNNNYLAQRQYILNNLDIIVPISTSGKDYFNKKYDPPFKTKIYVNRLGVENDKMIMTQKKEKSEKNKIHIVSCSSFVPVKRVEFIYKSILSFSIQSPKIEVTWTHIGGSKEEYDKVVTNDNTDNVKKIFLGQIKNTEIFKFYKNNKIDLFINLSSSEGIPVSIMEAQSFGIPVLATNVGGVSEIVNNQNGILLKGAPTLLEVVSGIESFLDYESRMIKSEKSKENWMKNYNAEINYSKFVNKLISIAGKKS
ncbi:MAG: glycosyltransferase [Candidatus Delongbacteria bacterium]|jgi:colanic acid/amylovoran biosynthesis glycosyltransferase|nr:glycosyltransferase [Candidatus Delongbacteria bacterium]